MGYAVPAHLEALGRLGPSPHHRSFFAPVVAARERHRDAAGRGDASASETSVETCRTVEAAI